MDSDPACIDVFKIRRFFSDCRQPLLRQCKILSVRHKHGMSGREDIRCRKIGIGLGACGIRIKAIAGICRFYDDIVGHAVCCGIIIRPGNLYKLGIIAGVVGVEVFYFFILRQVYGIDIILPLGTRILFFMRLCQQLALADIVFPPVVCRGWLFIPQRKPPTHAPILKLDGVRVFNKDIVFDKAILAAIGFDGKVLLIARAFGVCSLVKNIPLNVRPDRTVVPENGLLPTVCKRSPDMMEIIIRYFIADARRGSAPIDRRHISRPGYAVVDLIVGYCMVLAV